jgi:BirA family transcriptional regulator, biotin operon repressor / biotin---[acetyl-CoA-carboxylase] ligase
MRTFENTPYLSSVSFERAKAAVSGTRFADLRWVAETGSTNADVSAAISDRASPGDPIVLVADHQTAGRGRLQRSWEAPPGTSVLMTVGLPVDDVPPRRRTLLTSALALAVTDIRSELSVKWPNDLVVPAPADPAADDPVGYRKVGGILAEVHELAGAGAWALLGIGLNVNWPSIPAELESSATSLNLVVGHEVDREDLVADVLVAFDGRWLPLVEHGDPGGELLSVYRERSATLGRTVRVELPGRELVGVATDVADDGALVVTDDEGVGHPVIAGDVVHVRPVR